MSRYDAWKLMAPEYDGDPCPECGAVLVDDDVEKATACSECDYTDGVDWDNERERGEA